MSVRWSIEFSEEVSNWYTGLTSAGQASTDRILDRLAEQGNMLGMPHSKSLRDGLYELRFSCENVNRRITYVFDPDRRVVTLTTFRKQRQNERTEVLRARRVQAAHEASRHAEEKNGRRS